MIHKYEASYKCTDVEGHLIEDAAIFILQFEVTLKGEANFIAAHVLCPTFAVLHNLVYLGSRIDITGVVSDPWPEEDGK